LHLFYLVFLVLVWIFFHLYFLDLFRFKKYSLKAIHAYTLVSKCMSQFIFSCSQTNISSYVLINLGIIQKCIKSLWKKFFIVEILSEWIERESSLSPCLFQYSRSKIKKHPKQFNMNLLIFICNKKCSKKLHKMNFSVFFLFLYIASTFFFAIDFLIFWFSLQTQRLHIIKTRSSVHSHIILDTFLTNASQFCYIAVEFNL
jgi:hypothetical protein